MVSMGTPACLARVPMVKASPRLLLESMPSAYGRGRPQSQLLNCDMDSRNTDMQPRSPPSELQLRALAHRLPLRDLGALEGAELGRGHGGVLDAHGLQARGDLGGAGHLDELL